MVFLPSVKPTGNEVIGIDLGTTNSCVSVMEGKVGDPVDSSFIASLPALLVSLFDLTS